MEQIEAALAPHSEAIFKLHETVAATLGNTLADGLNAAFDSRLAVSSMRFFDLRNVPGIRGDLPRGVSDVRFRSDLSGIANCSARSLIERNALVSLFLPKDEAP
jgi:hypothetical protein